MASQKLNQHLNNKKFTIAVDFDGTIVENAWPKIGKLMPNAKEVLQLLHSYENIEIIIWTSRTDNKTWGHSGTLVAAVNFLVENDVPFDFVNQNDPTDAMKSTPKILADMYIDDRQIGGLLSWSEMFMIIKRDYEKFQHQRALEAAYSTKDNTGA